MYLKSLTLKGFKSFASATTLKFEPGICAVVGPNGSGKSNVVDALAWVMGEQGVKTLRGGKMEDVIFAGAGQRSALGRAEVTLTIDNSDQALDIEYNEVSITRRMYRDGASEYEINGARARLMDIQELLSDSGIGREMHVIVGQGKLAQILESRPEERRAFIEEAAGVLKHKRRKEKAQRKLQNMQANVDRLHDLTRELRRQLKPLARQAEAAKRAATVQATLRESRHTIAAYQLQQWQNKSQDSKTQVAQLQQQQAQIEAQLAQAQAQLEEAEAQLEQSHPRAEHSQQLWFDLTSLNERVQATKRIADDRKHSFQDIAYQGRDPQQLLAQAKAAARELESAQEQVDIAQGQLETLAETTAELAEQAREAESEHLKQLQAIADQRAGVARLVAAEESLRSRIAQTAAELERNQQLMQQAQSTKQSVASELEELTAHLDQQSRDYDHAQAALEQASTEATQAEQRLEQLRVEQRDIERAMSRLEATIDTLRASQRRRDRSGLQDLQTTPITNFIKPHEGYATALGAALGVFAQGLACEDIPSQWEEIPRAVFFQPGQDQSWRLDIDLPEDASWLLDQVDISAEYRGALTRLLVDVACVPTLNAARELCAAEPRLRVVTLRGQLLGEGWIQGGEGEQSPIQIEADIETASKELTALAQRLEILEGTIAGAQKAAEEARIQSASAAAQVRGLSESLRLQQREQQRLSQRLAQATAQEATQTEHQDQAQQRLQTLEQELAEAQERLERVDQAQPESADSVEQAAAQREQIQTSLSQARAMELEAQMGLRSAQQQVENLKHRKASLERQAEVEEQNRIRHEQHMQRRRQRAELAQTVAEKAAVLLTLVDEALVTASAQKEEAIAHRAQCQAQVQGLKQECGRIQHQMDALNKCLHELEVSASGIQVRLDDLIHSIREQFGMSPEELAHETQLPEDFDIEQEQARLAQAEKDLDALGKVNPLALEEYKALEERYEFLSTQLHDVEEARKDLRGVISDVDAKILQLFTDAYKDVAAQFPEVFATLFPGGQARLVLTDPDDMLTTGIEVEARPPGKKVKRLSLLSGGEKSLTALAMLVAIFKARPSPFYVMDEVEAALDDVNLRRLLALFEMLRKDSQLIVITHQKPTMDIANVLYGVTMRGDGVTRVLSQRMQPAAD